MTKEEMKKKFLELSEERRKILRSVDAATLIGIKDKVSVADKVIEINKTTIDFLCGYILEQISPCSEESIVWWSFILSYLGKMLHGTLSDKQKGLYEGISMTTMFIETSLTKIDMSQFPGGMKDE
jgi:hypothetical protein